MRSIAVDLKKPESRLIVDRLMSWAEIIHHSMRPGAAERLGVDYENASALNPTVVYGWAPGWGASGPMMNRQSFAPLMSGYVGVAYEVAGQFNDPLYPVGNEDPGNGLLGAFSMLLGVLQRRRSGEGQHLEHPQLNAAMAHTAHIVRQADGTALGAMRLDVVQLGFGPLERLYATNDGWICIVATSDSEFKNLVKVLAPEILDDPRFSSAIARTDNADALGDAIAAAVTSWSSAALLAELQAVDVAAAIPVPHNNTTFLRDPENLRTGRSAESPHPTRGRVREVGVLVRSSHSVMAPHRIAPTLGEHTTEILNTLGFDDLEIAALRSDHVVG